MTLADCHTHIFPQIVVEKRDKFFDGEPAFKLLYDNPKARLVNAEALINVMNKYEIQWSVTFGFPWQSETTCRIGNDYVLEAAAKYPDRLIPFVTLPCCTVDAALDELERCAKNGAAGFGELSFYCPDSICDTRQWQTEIAMAAAGKNLPSLWHVTEDVGHAYPGKGGMNPTEAVELIHSVCNATIILAHWGGGLPFYQLMPEVNHACADVYYDTAASPYLYDKKIFEVASSIVGADHILFGTDYPLLGPKRYLEQVRSCNLTDEQTRQILGGNLLRILGKETK